MTARRVPGAPSGASPEPLVHFTFDGREYEGVKGEPLAVSMLAADRVRLSRSFRFHRPRGLMCSTGGCGWCECEVDGVPSVRSCRVAVHEGLVARGEKAWPSVDHDLLSLVGVASRWIPPTFYHHRFLRPRRLRKRYLDVLRWFGGRGRLGSGARAALAGRPTRTIDTDVLVVGGGRAGLTAALGAAEGGARAVLVEAEPVIDAGWRADADRHRGTIRALADEAAAAGVEIRTGTTAIGWYDGMVAAIGADAHHEIRARSVVAATGSYERVPLVPGADRPGVMSARTVIGLIERYGVLPGKRALLIGSGKELVNAGQSLDRAGASEVQGPFATETLVAIGGSRRVTGAVLLTGGERRVAVDLVVFDDRSPNLDLVLAAGAAVEHRAGSLMPVADDWGRTSVPKLFVAGSAAGRGAIGRSDADLARAAGRAAADQALAGSGGSGRPAAAGTASPLAGQDGDHPDSIVQVAAPSAMVCFCEDVRTWEIKAERAAGYADSELVKRRTGALTGPCQGKYCLQSFACLVGDAAIPTARPPLRPVRLGDLVTGGTDEVQRA